MADTKEDIVIFIKKKPDWQVLLSAGIGMLVAPFAFGNVIYEYFTQITEIDRITLIFIIAIFLIAELTTIKGFLWHFRGQEKITMNSDSLILEKKGTILEPPVTYKLEKIKSFSLAENKRLEILFNRSGFNGGEIQFVYYGETVKFGQSLTRKEAKNIISKLNEKKETTNY